MNSSWTKAWIREEDGRKSRRQRKIWFGTLVSFFLLYTSISKKKSDIDCLYFFLVKNFFLQREGSEITINGSLTTRPFFKWFCYAILFLKSCENRYHQPL